MTPYTHGVLTDTRLEHIKQGKYELTPIDTSSLVNAGQFIDLASEHGLHQLWVLPGSTLSQRIGTLDDTFVTDVQAEYDLYPTELAPFLHGWKRNDSKIGAIDVVLTQYLDNAPISGLTTSKDLYAAIAYFERLLDIPFKWSTGRSGCDLLRKVNQVPERRNFLQPSLDHAELFYQHKTHDLLFSRPLTDAEKLMTYVHCFDRNAAYLSSAINLHVGDGVNYLVTKPEFDKTIPGLWHIRLAGTPLFDANLIPHPTDGKLDCWVDTAIVKTALEYGYQVEILEALITPKLNTHTTFNPWYDVLVKARSDLLSLPEVYKNIAARRATLDMIKAVYRHTVGLMGSDEWILKGWKHKWYYRPDYFNAFVDETRYRMMYHLRKCLEAGYSACCIYVDDLFIPSNDPNPLTAVPTLTLNTSVGRFHHKYTYPMRDVADFFTHDPYQTITALSQYKREEVTA